MKRIIIILLAIIGFVAVKGQIGYQVTLLNTATGEPRANETVSVSLDITDSAGGVIYSGSQTATTNDFGVLSLTVGNASTFDNVDWSKLPFFVSATVDGTLISRSQILSVPVAEYAKSTGQLTVERLCNKIWRSGPHSLSFSIKGNGTWRSGDGASVDFTWSMKNDIILLYYYGGGGTIYIYDPSEDCLIRGEGTVFR